MALDARGAFMAHHHCPLVGSDLSSLLQRKERKQLAREGASSVHVDFPWLDQKKQHAPLKSEAGSDPSSLCKGMRDHCRLREQASSTWATFARLVR